MHWSSTTAKPPLQTSSTFVLISSGFCTFFTCWLFLYLPEPVYTFLTVYRHPWSLKFSSLSLLILIFLFCFTFLTLVVPPCVLFMLFLAVFMNVFHYFCTHDTFPVFIVLSISVLRRVTILRHIYRKHCDLSSDIMVFLIFFFAAPNIKQIFVWPRPWLGV